MASRIKVFECYTEWKRNGLRRKLTKELAEQFDISLPTLYKWSHKPIEVNGIRYENWEDAYSGETQQIRENLRKEINEQLAEDYKLSDILANEIIIKYIEKVRADRYTPSIDELKVAVGIQDKKRDSVSATPSKEDIKSVGFTIGFRGDKIGNA